MNIARRAVTPRPGTIDHLVLMVLQFGYRIVVKPDPEYSPHSVARALKRLRAHGWLIHEVPLRQGTRRGTFLASLRGVPGTGDATDADGRVLAVQVLDHGFKVDGDSKRQA